MHRFSIAVVLACAANGCGAPTPRASGHGDARLPAAASAAVAERPAETIGLRFIGDFNWMAAADDATPRLGGISAACMAPDGQLLALSDARGRRGPERFYRLKLEVADDGVRFRVQDSVAFRGAPAGIDPEGLACAPNGELLVSSEGDGETSPRVPPVILRVKQSGRVLGALPLPLKFIPNPGGPLERGVRNNRGFEGLSRVPDGSSVYAANEQALAQDGPEPSFVSGTRVRLLRYDDALQPVAEYAYLTDPLPDPGVERDAITDADLGVSEILALDQRRLLVMERAAVAVRGNFRNRVRIYQVRLDTAIDVSQHAALDDRSPLLEKRLVLDLDTIVPRLAPGFRRLDNFEAMALGPRLASGERSLLLISDDNFSAQQRTVLLVFAIDPPR